jgi:RNA polymerase sigma factor (sigma-70 family)
LKELTWPDARLVRECLRGSEAAWTALIERYQNLIYSMPIKRGFSREAAGEVFQRVCLLLLAELRSLRDAKALPMWLIRVTSRECSRFRRQEERYTGGEPHERELARGAPRDDDLDAAIDQLHAEQSLREAIAELSPRCQRLIQMLFYEPEARPYLEVAQSLGLARGSIGFLRAGCLETLRRRLEKKRFASR